VNDKDSPLELKEACIVAAREVIAEHGVEQLSLRDVARRLGVSHQAPYKHYPSRDHLLAEVMRRCFVAFAQRLDARPTTGDAASDLGSLGWAYLQEAHARPLEYRLMFGIPWPEAAEHPELVSAALHAFNRLREALKRVHGAKTPNKQIDLDALFIWSSLHGLSSAMHSSLMDKLSLAAGVKAAAPAHLMKRLSDALRDR
jgi:AcrR family transcriptional regulator